MNCSKIFLCFFVLISLFVQFITLNAQENCQPPLPNVKPQPNIFTEEQENSLGDIVAENTLYELRVVDDTQLNNYLKRLGEKLLKHAPPSKINFKFQIMDIDDANAFSFPGGRIFVSRKLIAFVHSEDELASVIAHEIGHIYGRDSAEDITRLFRDVPGITSVTDKKDIFDKYNLFVDNANKKPDVFSRNNKHEGQQEIDADAMGFYLLVRAGYRPQAMQEMYDRLTENKGKRGSWVSDLFGTTKIQSKRFREMAKNAGSVPPSCIDSNLSNQEDFKKWQTATVNFTGKTKTESVTNVLKKQSLDPALRSDVSHLQFSPDGNFIIAQDDSGISVFTKSPFKLNFRIDAPDVSNAQFTSDSQYILFYNSDLRIEKWSIQDKKLEKALEPFIQASCIQSQLSPDGNFLACLDYGFSFRLFDITTNGQLIEKKNFYEPSIFEYLTFLLNSILNRLNETPQAAKTFINMDFSPDGRYFAAGRLNQDFSYYGGTSNEKETIAYDLVARKTVAIGGGVKRLLAGSFAFLDSERIVGLDKESPDKSGIVSFPKGDQLEKFKMYSGEITPATKGNFILLRGTAVQPLSVMDLGNKQFVKGHRQMAFDVYNDVFVAETINGEIGLFNFADNKLLSKILPPPSALGNLRAVAVSPDFKYLAVSNSTRGAIWDLEQNKRPFYVRGFRGSYFSEDGSLFADFPKYQDQQRIIAMFDLKSNQILQGDEIQDPRMRQYGKYLVTIKNDANRETDTKEKKDTKDDSDLRLEVQNTITRAVLWKQNFKKTIPRIWVNSADNTIVLQWSLNSEDAKQIIKNDAELTKQLSAMQEKEGDYLLQIFDATNGKQLGRLFIETGKGSFRISDVFATGDNILMTDTQNRVLVYSLSTGVLKGRAFGNKAEIAQKTNLLCIENKKGEVTLYDLNGMRQLETFNFTSSVSFARFNMAGDKLFVLTADQTVFIIDVSKSSTNVNQG